MHQNPLGGFLQLCVPTSVLTVWLEGDTRICMSTKLTGKKQEHIVRTINWKSPSLPHFEFPFLFVSLSCFFLWICLHHHTSVWSLQLESLIGKLEILDISLWMLNGHLKNTTMLNSPYFSLSENTSVAEARWVVDYISTQIHTYHEWSACYSQSLPRLHQALYSKFSQPPNKLTTVLIFFKDEKLNLDTVGDFTQHDTAIALTCLHWNSGAFGYKIPLLSLILYHSQYLEKKLG